MRILITVDPLIPVPPKEYGGIERIVDWLSRSLTANGHTVGLVAHFQSECEIPIKYRWGVFHTRLIPDGIICLRELRKFVSDFKPDVVHSFSRIFYLLGLLSNSSCPLLMSYQRHPSLKSVKLANVVFGNRLKFIGCSSYITELGKKGGGLWFCVHNGVELSKYQYTAEVANDAPIVFLSRIEPIKGTHLAVQIAKQSGRKLIIAGNFPSKGKSSRYWYDVIKPKVDGKYIEYVGPVNDIEKNKLLSQACALLVPVQWDEPFGIVFVEALACGTPVISCPKGALPEIVTNGKNGYLIQNVEQGVWAVNNIDKISREYCRKLAEQNFSSDVLVKKYEKIYNDVCQ